MNHVLPYYAQEPPLGTLSPGAQSGDPNQAFEAALTSVFQAANANSDFVTQELLWGPVGTFV
jgi:hypothetical protein